MHTSAEEMTFSMKIENKSRYFVENVSYPHFGDIAAQRPREPLKTFLYQSAPHKNGIAAGV